MVKDALEAYPIKERDWWILEWPGQTVLCVAMSYWTAEVSDSIRGGPETMDAYLNTCNEQINKVVALVRGKLSTQNRITLGMKLKFIFYLSFLNHIVYTNSLLSAAI